MKLYYIASSVIKMKNEKFDLDDMYRQLEKEFLIYYKSNSERMSLTDELLFNDIQNFITNSFYYDLLYGV